MSDLLALTGRLKALAAQDAAEMRAAAQEYFDSAYACDTPALRRFRRQRNMRGIALNEAADRLLALSQAVEAAARYRAAWDAYHDLPNGCDGRLMHAAHVELDQSRAALDAALAATSTEPTPHA